MVEECWCGRGVVCWCGRGVVVSWSCGCQGHWPGGQGGRESRGDNLQGGEMCYCPGNIVKKV